MVLCMRYHKPHRNIEQQVALLQQRGMQGDPLEMEAYLRRINYYRLSGYWYPFKTNNEQFQANTDFATIRMHYEFDHKLRLVVAEAVEHFEITLRTQFAYHHALQHGAFAYVDQQNSLPGLSATKFVEFQEKRKEELSRSQEEFIKHFLTKYGDVHHAPPLWSAIEIMSLGSVVVLYRGATHRVKQAVANYFRIPSKVMESWALTLLAIRNICAHHARLWNRHLGVKPLIPRADNSPHWHKPIPISNQKIFGIATILLYCMQHIDPQSTWPYRLIQLLQQATPQMLVSMGFPKDWHLCPIWKHM
jgi:abortive infection bacteriophage resistance protein